MVAKCRKWKPDSRPPARILERQRGLSNYVLVEVLSDEMRAGDLMVPGNSGASSEVTMQAFRVPAGVRVFNSEGLGRWVRPVGGHRRLRGRGPAKHGLH